MEPLQIHFKIRFYNLKDTKERINPLRTRHDDPFSPFWLRSSEEQEMTKQKQAKFKQMYIFK